MRMTLFEMDFSTGGLVEVNETNGDKNSLPVGQVLQLNGYADPEFVIIRNHGVDLKSPQYGAKYECVNLESGGASWKRSFELKWLKEKQDNRIQTYIADRVLSAQEMRLALECAEHIRLKLERQAREKKERQNKDLAALPGLHPHLKPNDKPAPNIRRDLKKNFPDVKFSVRSDHSSVNIRWTDGPTEKQVDEITRRYQEGNFSSMIDLYEYDRDNLFCEVFGGVRFVFNNRNETFSLIQKVAASMGHNLSDKKRDAYGCLEGLDEKISQIIFREARNTSA